MGGANSGVTESTKNIYLEGAYFDSVRVRKTAKRHAINSDASYRYERGIDPNATIDAHAYAVALLCELTGGTASARDHKGQEYFEALCDLLDEHVDWEKESEGSNESKGGGKEGKGEGRPTYTKEELKKIRDEVKENMLSSAQAAGAGNTPAEVQRIIKELTEPKMNWRELLRQQIQSTIRNDYTFSRPSRKGWHTGAILPGMNFMDTIDVAIGLDMSGSIGDHQAKDFLGEIKGIMEEYKDYNIKLWTFDTAVYNEQDFSADGGEDLLSYDI